MSEWMSIEQAEKATEIDAKTLRALAFCKIVPSRLTPAGIEIHFPTLDMLKRKAGEFVKNLSAIFASGRKRDPWEAVRLAIKGFAEAKGYKTFREACVELGIQPAALRHLIKEGKVKAIRLAANTVLVKIDDKLRMEMAKIDEGKRSSVKRFQEALEVLLND